MTTSKKNNPTYIPFKSRAQRAYLFMHEPAVAKKFAAHTPKGTKLPGHVKKSKKK